MFTSGIREHLYTPIINNMCLKITVKIILAASVISMLIATAYHYSDARVVEENIRGKFKYLYVSSPLGEFEATIGPHVVEYRFYENDIIGLMFPTYSFDCGGIDVSPVAVPKLVGFFYRSDIGDIRYFEDLKEFESLREFKLSGLKIDSINEIIEQERRGHMLFSRPVTLRARCSPKIIDLKFWTGNPGDLNSLLTAKHTWLYSFNKDRELIWRATEDYWRPCLDRGFRQPHLSRSVCQPLDFE